MHITQNVTTWEWEKMSRKLTSQEQIKREIIEFLKSTHTTLVGKARDKSKSDIFKLDGNVYAFDSTTIDLCLSVFWWAKFRKAKGGIKVHTLYDVETQIPGIYNFVWRLSWDAKQLTLQINGNKTL